MSAGYVIAQLKVTNPENYKVYVEKVTPLVKKFGGEFLVRAGEFQIFDGETNFPRIIILKFPTYEKALEWYNSEEYKPIKQIRLDNSEGTNIIIKGIWKNNFYIYAPFIIIPLATELFKRICFTGLYSSELYHSNAFS